MNKFTEIGIIRKIIFVLIMLIIFNFCAPTVSRASTSFFAKLGGSLIEPVLDMFVFIADGVIKIMQQNFLSNDTLIYDAQSDQYKEVKIIWIVAAVVAAAVLVVATAGVAGAVMAAGGVMATIGAVCSKAALTGVIAGISLALAGTEIADGLSGNFELPDIQYSPYAIFSGAIPGFDINFIGASEKDNVIWQSHDASSVDYLEKEWEKYDDKHGETDNERNYSQGIAYLAGKLKEKGVYSGNGFQDNLCNIKNYNCKNLSWKEFCEIFNEMTDPVDGAGLRWVSVEYKGISITSYGIEGNNSDPYDVYYMLLTQVFSGITDYEMNKYERALFSEDKYEYYSENKSEYNEKSCEGFKTEDGEIVTIEEYLLVQIFNNYFGGDLADVETKEYVSSANVLKNVISNGYKALTTLAMVLLMVILVYVGIRMVISSTASDKSKYKKMLLDWFIALCLLFVLHVMMLLIVTVTNELTSIFAEGTSDVVLVPLPEDTKYDGGKTFKGSSKDMNDYTDTATMGEKPLWATSYMGYIRLYAGVASESNDEKESTGYSVAYIIIYLVLVIYTVVFTLMYLKRVIYIAFLTLIAPLIAITYPLDKIKDGQAQAFNMWIREYIFNALLQPIHMLVYLLLISCVLEMAINYPIYSIVAIGFMMPAEKFIRSMFGFEKAQTVGTFGGAAVAGLLMGGINKMAAFGRGKDKDKEAEKMSDRVFYKDAMGGLDAMQASGLIGNGGPVPPAPGPVPPVPGAGGGPVPPVPGAGGGPVPPVPGAGGGPVPPRPVPPRPVPPRPVPPRPVPTSRIRRFGRKLKKGAGNTARGLQGAGAAIYKKGHSMRRTLIRGVARGIGAVGFGTVGLAAGVATGDFGKAAQMAAGGAFAGYTIGGAGATTLMNKGSEAFEGFKQGFYGPEYQDRVNAKALQEFKADGQNRNTFARNLTEEERKNIDIDSYFKQNISSAQDMITAERLKKRYQNEGMSSEKAFNAAIGSVKLTKQMGSDPRNNPEAEAKWLKNFTESCGSASAAKEIMRRAKTAFDVKEGIK